VGGGAYAPRYSVQGRPYGGGASVGNARPSFYHPGWNRRRGYAAPYGYGVGVGYVGYGWLDANDPGYDSGYGYDSGEDAGSGDNGAYDVGPYQDPGVAGEGYDDAAAGEAGLAPDAEEQPVPYAPAARGYEAGAARTSSVAPSTPVAKPSLYNNDAVTLIFKDGRAPEKIYNYALTRTTLYVTDAKRQEIPVAALDLAATEKVNRAAGVRFQLPVTQ
jgi:hypothetical protein